MTTDPLRTRFRGCLLGLAVGDALGRPFEGRGSVDREELRRWADASATLRWTDDTAMALGVGRSLVACGGFDGAHMARVFADAHDAEPWRGYGAGPPRVFAELRRGVAWYEAASGLFGGEGSHGNGGAMRVAPVGLAASDREEVVRVAQDQARITHAHPLGREGATLMALAVRWAVHAREDADPRDLVGEGEIAVTAPALRVALHRLASLPSDAPHGQVRTLLGNGVAAAEAVPAALHGFLRQPRSFADAVSGSILLGGDTDTIAAMTGAASGAFLGEGAVPAWWRERLEDADQLVRLADDLLSLHRAGGSPQV